MDRINELISKGLENLTDEEVTELGELIAEESARVVEISDEELTEEDVQVMDALITAKDAHSAEVTRRDEVKAEAKAKADELRKKLRGEEDSGGEPGEGEGDEEGAGEGEGETAPEGKEPVAAAGTPAKTRKVTRPSSARPAERDPAAPVLVAAANLQGMAQGSVIDSPEMLTKALKEAHMAGKGWRGGGRVEVPVATLRREWPEDRLLSDTNVEANEAKINAVALTARRTLVAAGGICAPAPVDYTLPVIGATDRPIRDALPNFGATRGAIRTLVPPTIDDVDGSGVAAATDAIGQWTEANDQNPTAPTAKPCFELPCGTDATSVVYALTQCIKFGNFRDRFFPEQIVAFSNLISVWRARYAERLLITTIDTASTAKLTAGQLLGTTRDVMAALDRYNAQVRAYYRLSDNDRFRLLAPRWLRDNMRADLAREMPGSTQERLAMADAEINAFFSSRGFNTSWIWESVTGQEMSTKPVTGGLAPWISTVSMYIFLEGAWQYLDGGELNVGVVRDSTLVGVNKLQMFEENFENVHFHGTFSHRLNVDICPSGTAAALATSTGICTTGS